MYHSYSTEGSGKWMHEPCLLHHDDEARGGHSSLPGFNNRKKHLFCTTWGFKGGSSPMEAFSSCTSQHPCCQSQMQGRAVISCVSCSSRPLSWGCWIPLISLELKHLATGCHHALSESPHIQLLEQGLAGVCHVCCPFQPLPSPGNKPPSLHYFW